MTEPDLVGVLIELTHQVRGIRQQMEIDARARRAEVVALIDAIEESARPGQTEKIEDQITWIQGIENLL